MKKKILIGCGVALAIFIIAVILIVKFVPGKSLKKLVGTDNALSEVLCIYPVKVQGKSMEPTFTEGSTVNFNKCFEKEDVALNTIIVFKEDGTMRLGKVRSVEDDVYKVSPEARENDISDVAFDEIIATY